MARRAACWIAGAMVVAGVAAPRARAVQETTRVSVDSSGKQGNGGSRVPALSADGRFVVFMSDASNLVAGDANGVTDIFVHDRSTGTTELVSVDSSGNPANDWSLVAGSHAISADGSLVVFTSWASNLDPNDTNGDYDVFVRDRSAGTTTLVSVDSNGVVGSRWSRGGFITDDGRFVTFTSYASNLVANDNNSWEDVFVRDLVNGTTERISVSTTGGDSNFSSGFGSMSADGRYVAFDSGASNLVAVDKNGNYDVFLRDRQAGTTTLVSVDSNGKQGNLGGQFGNISADGTLVSFLSFATDLVAGDTNNSCDIFLRDAVQGTTVRISVDSTGVEGDGDSMFPAMTQDGRAIVFESAATNLVAGDTNNYYDIFVHDMVSGVTSRVSVDSAGRQSNGLSQFSSLSSDGSLVAFDSWAGNLLSNDSNGVADVFVHETCYTPANWTNYGAGFPGTLGVPSLTARQLPTFGATIDVDLANSYGQLTLGFLVLGVQRASLPTKWGGDLLVLPTRIVPISFFYGPDTFTGTIPVDVAFCGFVLDLQGVEFDPGAQYGMSFSPGLELVIGS